MGLIYVLKYMDNFTKKSCGESYLYTAEAIFFQVFCLDCVPTGTDNIFNHVYTYFQFLFWVDRCPRSPLYRLQEQSYISSTSHCFIQMCLVLHKFHFSLFDGDVSCPT